VAFLGIWLSHVFRTSYLDSSASIFIGLILVAAARFLALETRGLLVGESADQQQVESIRSAIQSHRAVKRVGDLLTMQVGPEQVLVTANIEFRRDLNTGQLETAVDQIEEAVRQKEPEVKRIFFEAEGLSGRQSRQAA